MEVVVRFQHVSLVVLSGLVWLAVGVFLMIKGLNLIVFAGEECWVLSGLTPMMGSRDQAMVLLIALGLFAGFIKGRWVLTKSIKRVVNRILSLPEPVKITEIYSRGYYLLLASMMGIGLMMNLFGIPHDLRGMIDVAIGSALMNGAMGYFRMAYAVKKNYL
jgi:hypothetical protein